VALLWYDPITNSISIVIKSQKLCCLNCQRRLQTRQTPTRLVVWHMTMNSDPEPLKNRRDAAGRFGAGNTIGAAGRPKGSRNQSSLAAEKLLNGQAEALSQKVIEIALAGDTVALRLCLERILPPRRDRVVEVELPRITSAVEALDAMTCLVECVANGQLSASEADGLASLIERRAKLAELSDIEQRLSALEKAAG